MAGHAVTRWKRFAVLTWTAIVLNCAPILATGAQQPAAQDEGIGRLPTRDLLQLVSELPVSDVWTAIGVSVAVLAALFSAGYYLGGQKQVHDHAHATLERNQLKAELENMRTESSKQNKRVATSINAYAGLDPEQVDSGAFVKSASELEAFKQRMLSTARHRIWYVGASFHVTTTMHRAALAERVQSGVEVRVMFSDPDGLWLSANAASFGRSTEELKNEVDVTQSGLESLAMEISLDDRLQFRVVDEVFSHGVYMYDVDSGGGGTIVLVPHVWGKDAPAVPAIVVDGSVARTVVGAYRRIFEDKWVKAKRLAPKTLHDGGERHSIS